MVSKRDPLPNVLVAVLNYERWHDTLECVESLRKSDYPTMKILIVDNGSRNDSEQSLREALPGIDVLQTGSNLGYTGGINYAVKIARTMDPAYILILNPDTLVDKHFLEHLVHAMEECRSAAAACGTIHYLPQRIRAWYAGGKMIPWRGLAVHGTAPPPEPAPLFIKTDFVTGCLLLLRTEFLDSIGTLDERFFMYLDDIEYSARIARKGFDLLYVPASVIYHQVLREDVSIHKLYYSFRNRFLLINTAFSGVQGFLAKAYFLVVAALKLVFWFVQNPSFYRVARMGLNDYFRGRFGAGRGLSLIEGGRP